MKTFPLFGYTNLSPLHACVLVYTSYSSQQIHNLGTSYDYRVITRPTKTFHANDTFSK
jgi:hypothetical protein